MHKGVINNDAVVASAEFTNDNELFQGLINYIINQIGSGRSRGQNRRRMVPRLNIADWHVLENPARSATHHNHLGELPQCPLKFCNAGPH